MANKPTTIGVTTGPGGGMKKPVSNTKNILHIKPPKK